MASNAPELIGGAGGVGAFRHKLGASQTFIKGALVVWSSNYIVECSAAPTAIYGIALEDATSGTAGTYDCLIQPLKADAIYKFDLVDADTLAQADLGEGLGLVKETHWAIDISDAGDQVFALEPVLVANEGIGDARSVYVKFDPSKIQLHA